VRTTAEKLPRDLTKGLAPIYLLAGDEPLQQMEMADAVRTEARKQGFSERELLEVDGKGFDWSALTAAAGNLSLFADKRLIELRIPSGKPGADGSKALTAWAADPPPDLLLLITCGKLDRQQQNGKWFTALDNAGVVALIYPIDHGQLPGWVARRLKQKGLTAPPEALALLAERVEGNLLAAAQEVDKLALLHGEGELSLAQVREAVADSARFNLFDLVDAAVAGEAGRVGHLLDGLRGEGTEPILVNWALARELRLLTRISAGMQRGLAFELLCKEQKVWQNRKGLVQRALKRHPTAQLSAMLGHCARIDLTIKGERSGNPWHELIQLSLALAGRPLPLPPTP